ncbi:helix-turn-helix transcriptional regulator [Streptomyces sp. NPDC001941]|uniref:helix-turn-helix domain-containing protein n=1 Tax=Streptomyces sp. NPDC001941 TaxID=3154659 RepID=UPI0033262A30
MAFERQTHLSTDHVLLADVQCASPPPGWTDLRPAGVFGLVMVRRGLFRGRVDGVDRVVDPASVYVERPGADQQFSHPCGGDAYTEIVLSEPQVAAMLGGDPRVPEGLAFTTPELTVQHRLLLTRAREDADAFELAERTVMLAACVLEGLAPARAAGGRPSTAHARRRLVDDARAALDADLRLGLDELGRAVGCSPHHLSRVFTTTTGTTLTRYRNRLRLARALERLGEGERDLGRLADELGFSDQAHMTHVVRETTGMPPGRLRSLLAPAPAPAGARGGSAWRPRATPPPT